VFCFGSVIAVVVGRRLVGRCQCDVDVVGVGNVEFGVDGVGLLPMVSGLVVVAGVRVTPLLVWLLTDPVWRVQQVGTVSDCEH